MIDPQEMEYGGVDVVHGYRILHRTETKAVGRAELGATTDAGAGQPIREPVLIVVAPGA